MAVSVEQSRKTSSESFCKSVDTLWAYQWGQRPEHVVARKEAGGARRSLRLCQTGFMDEGFKKDTMRWKNLATCETKPPAGGKSLNERGGGREKRNKKSLTNLSLSLALTHSLSLSLIPTIL